MSPFFEGAFTGELPDYGKSCVGVLSNQVGRMSLFWHAILPFAVFAERSALADRETARVQFRARNNMEGLTLYRGVIDASRAMPIIFLLLRLYFLL